jgi:hypothetical protein
MGLTIGEFAPFEPQAVTSFIEQVVEEVVPRRHFAIVDPH